MSVSILRPLLVLLFMLTTSTACGQAQIVDSQPIGAGQADPAASPQDAPALTAGGELYFQVQALQEEVLELRGLLEQQSNELRKLQQRVMDDYIDLDQRIGQLGGQRSSRPAPIDIEPEPVVDAPARSINTPVRSINTPARTIEPPAAPPGEELASYRAAIDLVLKQRKFDDGIAALQQYLEDYPNGNYAANAKFWLGQIYMQTEELDNSVVWFERVVQQHPVHQKTDEARLKLGRVYDSMGRREEALEMLQQAASSSNQSVAMQAADYLSKIGE